MILLLLACSTAEPPAQQAPPEVVEVDTSTDVMVEMFEGPAACGECHPTHYAQWRTSMHAYAAQSPVFDAMAAKAYRDTSGEVGEFCTRCHSPIGELQGEPGWYTAAERSEISREGVSCDVCHSTVDHVGPVGNANLLLVPEGPKQGPFPEPATDHHPAEESLHIQSAEFCGTCHDVFMEPGLDIEEAFTEYNESPAKDQGLRCQDCHMGPEPGVLSERDRGPAAIVDGVAYPDRILSDHSFVGPDYSLLDAFPFEGDEGREARAAYLEKSATLLKNAIEVSGLTVTEQGVEDTYVHVELTSLVSGHRVPTGFTSERQLWIELTVKDTDGVVVFQSGDLDSQGDLRDTHSADVHSGATTEDLQLVNLQSKNMSIQREWQENGGPSTEQINQYANEEIFPFDANWIEKNSLGPLESMTSRFHVKFPDEHPGGVGSVEVRLRYRNLPPYVLRALQLDDLVGRLHIVDIDSETWEPEAQEDSG